LQVLSRREKITVDLTKVVEFPVKEFFRQPRCLIGAGAWEMGGPEAKTMASTMCSL